EQVAMPGSPIEVPTQPKAMGLGTLGLNAQRGSANLLESIKRRGQAEYKPNAEGEMELPKRVGGVNLFRFAGDDAAKKELIAGAQLTNAEQVDAQRFIEEGVLERAAGIEKWGNIDAVKKLKPNEVLDDANTLSLDNYTMGAVSKF